MNNKIKAQNMKTVEEAMVEEMLERKKHQESAQIQYTAACAAMGYTSEELDHGYKAITESPELAHKMGCIGDFYEEMSGEIIKNSSKFASVCEIAPTEIQLQYLARLRVLLYSQTQLLGEIETAVKERLAEKNKEANVGETQPETSGQVNSPVEGEGEKAPEAPPIEPEVAIN